MFVFEPQVPPAPDAVMQLMEKTVGLMAPLMGIIVFLFVIKTILGWVTHYRYTGSFFEPEPISIKSDAGKRIKELEEENERLREEKKSVNISFTAEDFQQAQKNIERLAVRELAPLTPYPVEETRKTTPTNRLNKIKAIVKRNNYRKG